MTAVNGDGKVHGKAYSVFPSGTFAAPYSGREEPADLTCVEVGVAYHFSNHYSAKQGLEPILILFNTNDVAGAGRSRRIGQSFPAHGRTLVACGNKLFADPFLKARPDACRAATRLEVRLTLRDAYL